MTSDESMSIEAVIELAGHPNILGLVEDDAAKIAKVKAATASIEREVTVTHVFAAVTGRMLAPRETADGADFYLGGYADRWSDCAGCCSAEAVRADANEEGGISDAGREYGGDAGRIKEREQWGR